MFDRGALVPVPYPFTDLSSSKRRPVLVLAAPDTYGDFVGLPVTSRPRPEHGLPLLQENMSKGTLPAPSWIRTDRIVTLSSGLLVKIVGEVAPEVVDRAAQRFWERIGGGRRD